MCTIVSEPKPVCGTIEIQRKYKSDEEKAAAPYLCRLSAHSYIHNLPPTVYNFLTF